MTDNTDPESGIDREALRDHAIDEAKRVRDDVPGDTERLRTQRAILDRERELNGFEVERRQARQQITDAEADAERIRGTMRRLGEHPAREVFEKLPDGTLLRIPEDAREEFVSRLNTQLSEALSRIETQQDRAESIQRGLVTNKLAIEWLEGQLADVSDDREHGDGEQ